MKKLTINVLLLMLVTVTLGVAFTARADEEKLRPFILAERKSGSLPEVVTYAKDKLTANGFEVAGEYAPYENAYVIVVTNPTLKRVAGRSDMGGFGAAQRVSVTVVDDQVQLAYTNPRYMANAYRMDGDLGDVAEALGKALGSEDGFGAQGKTANELRRYHYKMFMPYFDEAWKVGSFASQKEAVRTIEQNLKKGVAGASEVYRVDMPDSNQTLIGVGLTEGCGGDQFIMDTINSSSELKSTPHLPYELLVSKGEVLALHAKFRIAQSFPDLTMLGKGSFWDIKCAPDSIRHALSAVTGNQKVSDY